MYVHTCCCMYLYKFNGYKDAEGVNLSDIEVNIGCQAGEEHHDKEHHQERDLCGQYNVQVEHGVMHTQMTVCNNSII